MPIINTRVDLDALKGTPAQAEAMRALAGTLVQRVDVAAYPAGYGMPDYAGPAIAPQWQDVESLATILRMGFADRAAFEAEQASGTGVVAGS
ncbi:hypothetical protein [Jiella sp. M17.18]|uniref:hypothetical protein n=1 Tax=Jiella sp. M17.18 TaxID=3234247 RepID=UPI0034DF1C80